MGASERSISGAMAFNLSQAQRARVSQPAVSWELESLVREYSRLVFRIAYSVVRNHMDSEDVVQEVFMRLAKHGTQGIKDPKAWISRIAWRVSVDRYRHTKRAQQEAFDERTHTPAQFVSTEQGAISRETLALLDRMIAALPRKEREALLLTSVEEMSSAEAAQVLVTTETSIRARVFRARQRLTEKLENMKVSSYGR